ncbi:CHAT domain-containing protein [Chamaesiphon sp. VAR_48_metabat_135_sub]|uniref:CHAT domain-containing protein n=1 Tax=Chamaesiphon sp. VAR_48_metabat_135_sub TaxID=2964699 RepID=UPI00286B2CC6|nr:CHAT domain-containing protein [Chamaesiphon sp. VAR_48_metabat_135_sub]
MKQKKFVWMSISIACLWLVLNISNYPRSSSIAITIPYRAATGVPYLSVIPKPQPINSKKLQRSLDSNNFVDAIGQVELGWQYQYETYYQGKLKSQYFELPEIQQQLANINKYTKSNSALLYAIPTPDGLHLILVTAKGETIHKTVKEANATTLPEVANSLRLNLVNPQTTSAEYLPPAQQLDRWLIGPIAAELKANKIDTILFCLGTGLRGLTLAALHDGQRFLVERYNLAIIPAFNLLETRWRSLSVGESTTLKGLKVLAMGADKFTDNANLPAVPLELATITQRGFWQGKVFLNEAFTLKQFQQARSQTPYGIVHLATHADISAKSVKDSYIQFWDRRLQLDRVRDLRLDKPAVQLLVLSACRTALGTPNAELGFAGLAVLSGAKSVLASLWSVDDVGTLVLMSDFYQQLKTAPIKSNALRSTQVAMLTGNLTLGNSAIRRVRGGLPAELQPLLKRDLSHPYYWAAFTTIGNPW